jgi:hypothetical protein
LDDLEGMIVVYEVSRQVVRGVAGSFGYLERGGIADRVAAENVRIWHEISPFAVSVRTSGYSP